MFNQLTNRLSKTLETLRGIHRFTEDNIKEAIGDIRRALIEADVALPVVKTFIDSVTEKAIGQTIIKQVRPEDAFVKIVQDELTAVLGGETTEINLRAQKPVIILMAGLQGSGKTTTTAKLAKLLSDTQKKLVLMTSVDIYRPAALEQLATLAKQINVQHFPSTPQDKPLDIVKNAIDYAKKHFLDVLIIDTAGRLHIDHDMMQEIQAISKAAQPTETLLVVDSMAGQDAANIAKTFNEQLALTGIVLTKTDGDARGGAALSMRIITGKPIKFIGTSEKMDGLVVFHPERAASRILGMGDIVSLVESVKQKVDKKEADKIAKKLQSGKRFDFNDFLAQLNQMKKMGSMQSIMDKIPGFAKIPKGAAAMMDDKALVQMEAIILSMTQKERRFPALINGSRKQRIAKGSGTTLQDIGKLLKQFLQMQKMLKKFGGNKMEKRMKQLEQFKDQLPPELLSQLPNKFK
ncbi:MAG TPA: signal recognition particle protein [Coxiellaceae bacterium]|nr:MAG: signal recognition particle protein [Gammaproteobacteria bacterium RIFCSPHIGHO2_12_FULL_36_30]HLB56344.1 signal recognition particle protein [Coxiellaceae bacterium]